MRGVWKWGLTFLLLETFAWVQIIRGFFGELAVTAWQRIASIEGALELHRAQLQAAIENKAANVDVYSAFAILTDFPTDCENPLVTLTIPTGRHA